MPKLVACGSRSEAYDDFRVAFERASRDDIIMLLVDSEDRVADINSTWEHLRQRDGWQRPRNAADEDVLFMTTSMETWIVADRETLHAHFGQHFRDSALPSLDNLENRSRQDVLRRLEHATRDCPATYAKGPKSFEVLGKINPDAIAPNLPSFRRARNILAERL